MRRRAFLVAMFFLLTACDEVPNFAPVADAGSIEPVPQSGVHRVARGETLYEIAWRYGMDYRVLAVRNSIPAPYAISPGQLIALRTHATTEVMKPQLNQTIITTHESNTLSPAEMISTLSAPNAERNEPNFSVAQWIWPVEGKIVAAFSAQNKGINFVAPLGQPILATAAGTVVYAGAGLRGYGNLIIIKHNAQFLSAYAHNSILFVHEGDWVNQGQKIAEMGNTGSDKVMLHFEIRRAGQPVDPIAYIHFDMNSRYNRGNAAG